MSLLFLSLIGQVNGNSFALLYTDTKEASLTFNLKRRDKEIRFAPSASESMQRRNSWWGLIAVISRFQLARSSSKRRGGISMQQMLQAGWSLPCWLQQMRVARRLCLATHKEKKKTTSTPQNTHFVIWHPAKQSETSCNRYRCHWGKKSFCMEQQNNIFTRQQCIWKNFFFLKSQGPITF